MKTALKAAIPVTLAIVLAYVIIKLGEQMRTKYAVTKANNAAAAAAVAAAAAQA